MVDDTYTESLEYPQKKIFIFLLMYTYRHWSSDLIIIIINIIIIIFRHPQIWSSHHYLRHHQGCTNRCSLAAGLRGNGERMRKWGGNGEKMRKWREIDSLHFLIISLFPPSFSISSFSLHFLSISSFSLHFLAARLQGCNDSCSPDKQCQQSQQFKAWCYLHLW